MYQNSGVITPEYFLVKILLVVTHAQVGDIRIVDKDLFVTFPIAVIKYPDQKTT